MGNYNRFGATYDKVVALYPKTVTADYDPSTSGLSAGGQAEIESVLDRMSRLVAAALPPTIYQQMVRVDAQEAERFARAGQTTATVGLVPVIANTQHVWRFPPVATMIPSRYSNVDVPDFYYKKPERGYFELTVGTDYSFDPATGIITFLSLPLSFGERVYVTYDVDVDNAAFAVQSLADAVVLGAAVFLGNRLYSEDTQKWELVTEYEKQWTDLLTALRAGQVIPDEMRRLVYWKEVERASNQWGSVQLKRG